MNDVTSFHPAYKSHGPDRESRHKILYIYEQPGPVRVYDPETWMYRDQIVLDLNDDPVRKWTEIPLVLSSAYEGYDMEVVRRLNPQITYRDFRARMPRSFIKGSTRKDSLGPSTLSMRNTRFRLSACCLAWDDRQGSDTLKEYLDAILPPECLRANSTEAFRDLTAYEVEQAKAPNKGNFLERAGRRALDDVTRQNRNQNEQKRSKQLLAQHEKTVGAALQPALLNPAPRRREPKRKRAESSSIPEDEGEDTRPAKRLEWADNIDPKLRESGLPVDARGTFVGPAPAVCNASNGTSGLGQVNSPPQQGEVPELQVQVQISEIEEFEVEPEYPPLDMEQPAANRPPYYYNSEQLKAFAKRQIGRW